MHHNIEGDLFDSISLKEGVTVEWRREMAYVWFGCDPGLRMERVKVTTEQSSTNALRTR